MERRFRHWMVRACDGPSALYRAEVDSAVVERFRPEDGGWAAVAAIPERAREVHDPGAVRTLQEYLAVQLGPWLVPERDGS